MMMEINVRVATRASVRHDRRRMDCAAAESVVKRAKVGERENKSW